MDLSKLGSATWSEPGTNPKSADAVSGFLGDIQQGKLTNSVGDLLQVTRSRHQRQFLAPKQSSNLAAAGQLSISASTPNLGSSNSSGFMSPPHDHAHGHTYTPNSHSQGGYSHHGQHGQGHEQPHRKRLPVSPLRKPPLGVSYTVQERPANRSEIASLEVELDERVRSVFESAKADLEAVETGDMYQPHKDSVFLVRDRIFKEFNLGQGADTHSHAHTVKMILDKEPWLDRLIQCESLIVVCDEVCSKLVDMLSVSSTELGNVLRKLRHTYTQSFGQMRSGWKHLRSQLLTSEEDLRKDETQLRVLRQELREKEREVRLKVEGELHQLEHEFKAERARDKEKLATTEFKMEQMSETLRSLNGIFKAMQTDGGAARTSDLVSRNLRLERENADLGAEMMKLDKLKAELAEAQKKLAHIEVDFVVKDTEIETLRQQLSRRDEAITGLMERESLRNAEIEKLKLFTKIQQEQEQEQDSFKEQATAVLCIKCKKSLDDLSNIRSAVLGSHTAGGGGDPNNPNATNKLPCEHFRSLLPNLRGRKPNRSTAWLRSCMRAILFTKMKEDVSLLSIHGEISRFPEFVYSWFERPTEGLSGSRLTSVLNAADDDRWGLYYGCKALAKDDPEAMVFWALLTEDYNDDGLQFVCHCLSVLFSLGGGDLWAQFGARIVTRGGNAATLFPPGITERGDSVRPHVWIHHEVAKEAVCVVLARALKVHVVEALDAVEALKAVPEVEEPDVDDGGDAGVNSNNTTRELREGDEGFVSHDGPGHHQQHGHSKPAVPAAPASKITGTKDAPSAPATAAGGRKEPTHISLFMWLRLMLQQLAAEQIHRNAAVRLMFETASVGALTPQLHTRTLAETPGEQGNQVRFPQFASISKTLFPNISTLEVASLYVQCYSEGHRKVTAEVFQRVADRKGLFSRALRLSPLPLLAQHGPLTEARPELDPQVPIVENSEEVSHIPDFLLTDPLNAHMHGLSKENVLRTKLGALIHRKLAAVKPDLLQLMGSLPEKWKALLQEALDACTQSLQESFQQIVRARFETFQETPKSRKHIDGIQPFVHYRRLLTLALLVKGLTDNPLLPTELFGLAHRGTVLPSLHISLCSVESLLTQLEFALVNVSTVDVFANAMANKEKNGSGAGSATLQGGKHFQTLPHTVSRVVRFEAARRSLVARKIQFIFKHFVKGCEFLVPRGVRLVMRPGYLLGRNGIKKREVLHAPWFVQEVAAGVLNFKLAFDSKAGNLGLDPIPLESAVIAFHYLRWGSLDAAERAIHDFYYNLHMYTHGAPRLRLFSAFLSEDASQDEAVSELLRTPQAVSVYTNLVMEIHREKYLEQLRRDGDLLASSEAAAPGDLTEVSALGLIITDGSAPEVVRSGNMTTPRVEATRSDDSTNAKRGGGRRGSRQGLASIGGYLKVPQVDILFPQSFSALERSDKRDVWNEDIALCKRSIMKWGKAIRGLDPNTLATVSDLAEKLRKAPNGEIDVDELCWLVMVQWAKYMAWYAKRAALRAQWSERNSVPGKVLTAQERALNGPGANPSQNDNAADTTGDAHPPSKTNTSAPGSAPTAQARTGPLTGHALVVASIAKSRKQLRLSCTYLQSLAESIYRPGDGPKLVDPLCVGAYFAYAIASSSSLSPQGMHKTSLQTMESFLKKAALVDLNSGPQLVHMESTTTQLLKQTAAVSAAGMSNANAASGAGAAAGSADQKRGSFNARGSFLAKLQAGHAAHEDRGHGAEDDFEPAHRYHTPKSILTHASPDIQIAAASLALESYHDPLNSLMARAEERLATSADPDIQRKVLHLRRLVIMLGDVFQAERDYRAQMQAQQVSLSFDRQEHSQQTVKLVNFAKDAWMYVQQILSDGDELAVLMGEGFVEDMPPQQRRVVLDRCYVYNILTKSVME